MPKIQVFVSKAILENINTIVIDKRNDGAKEHEANTSNTASMLIELGLKVYELQQKKTDSNFNQTEFNKVILENVVKTSFICQKLLGINSFMSEIQDNEKLDYKLMAYAVRNDTAEVINEFFPKNEENT
ncbi:TraM conjugal transfer protein [Candidatus Regiella insecticola LSR1]|uniref:Relaxosome protein TraM n=1 Tax=Candidatus Regiella insecticola LSR1 TaxID=663321 RepID=E0WR85_9ENTR|nr:conjugal transfer relaxosome DNA-binding protein TraM [Candidatus Regiella insecticola]EFL92645.1 TraM conjugal transfer protein [Candidatus Regiella insecticola LSR1]